MCCKMKARTGVFLCILSLVSAVTESGKVFLFPKQSDSAYVELIPKQPVSLNAFTLCMRLSTEMTDNREVILFSYRTKDHDELNIWRESDGRISVYIRSSNDGALYRLPPLSTFPTHLCLTWESSTGLTAFWVDGRRSVLQFYKKNSLIQPGGTIILGQDADTYLGKFDFNQSFVGEITDVNLWDYVLPASQIKDLSEKQCCRKLANVIDWYHIQYKIHGDVAEVDQY